MPTLVPVDPSSLDPEDRAQLEIMQGKTNPALNPPRTILGEGLAGVGRGTLQALGAGMNTVAGAGDAAGFPVVKEMGTKAADYLGEAARNIYSSAPSDIRDVRSFRELSMYGSKSVGELTPQVAGSIAAAAATRNPAVGMGAFSAIQEFGSIYGDQPDDQKDPGKAFVAGMGAAALDVVPGVAALKRTGLSNWIRRRAGLPVLEAMEPAAAKRARNFLTAGGREAGLEILQETPTETMQTGIERWGAGKPLTGDEALGEYINTAASVAMGMGPMGGFRGAAGHLMSGQNTALPPEDQAAHDAALATIAQNLTNQPPLTPAGQAAQQAANEAAAELQQGGTANARPLQEVQTQTQVAPQRTPSTEGGLPSMADLNSRLVQFVGGNPANNAQFTTAWEQAWNEAGSPADLGGPHSDTYRSIYQNALDIATGARTIQTAPPVQAPAATVQPTTDQTAPAPTTQTQPPATTPAALPTLRDGTVPNVFITPSPIKDRLLSLLQGARIEDRSQTPGYQEIIDRGGAIASYDTVTGESIFDERNIRDIDRAIFDGRTDVAEAILGQMEAAQAHETIHGHIYGPNDQGVQDYNPFFRTLATSIIDGTADANTREFFNTGVKHLLTIPAYRQQFVDMGVNLDGDFDEQTRAIRGRNAAAVLALNELVAGHGNTRGAWSEEQHSRYTATRNQILDFMGVPQEVSRNVPGLLPSEMRDYLNRSSGALTEQEVREQVSALYQDDLPAWQAARALAESRGSHYAGAGYVIPFWRDIMAAHRELTSGVQAQTTAPTTPIETPAPTETPAPPTEAQAPPTEGTQISEILEADRIQMQDAEGWELAVTTSAPDANTRELLNHYHLVFSPLSQAMRDAINDFYHTFSAQELSDYSAALDQAARDGYSDSAARWELSRRGLEAMGRTVPGLIPASGAAAQITPTAPTATETQAAPPAPTPQAPPAPVVPPMNSIMPEDAVSEGFPRGANSALTDDQYHTALGMLNELRAISASGQTPQSIAVGRESLARRFYRFIGDTPETQGTIRGNPAQFNSPIITALSNALGVRMDFTRPGQAGLLALLNAHPSTLEVLAYINENSDNAFHRKLAAALSTAFGSHPPAFTFQPSNSLGSYSRATHSVNISSTPGKSSEQAILHEMCHAATIRGIVRNPRLAERINELYQRTHRWATDNNVDTHHYYGLFYRSRANVGQPLTSSHTVEFIAEAMSRREFQELLSTIPASDQADAPSVWDRIVEAVAQYLGLTITPRTLTALDEAMSLSTEALAATRTTFGMENSVITLSPANRILGEGTPPVAPTDNEPPAPPEPPTPPAPPTPEPSAPGTPAWTPSYTPETVLEELRAGAVNAADSDTFGQWVALDYAVPGLAGAGDTRNALLVDGYNALLSPNHYDIGIERNWQQIATRLHALMGNGYNTLGEAYMGLRASTWTPSYNVGEVNTWLREQADAYDFTNFCTVISDGYSAPGLTGINADYSLLDGYNEITQGSHRGLSEFRWQLIATRMHAMMAQGYSTAIDAYNGFRPPAPVTSTATIAPAPGVGNPRAVSEQLREMAATSTLLEFRQLITNSYTVPGVNSFNDHFIVAGGTILGEDATINDVFNAADYNLLARHGATDPFFIRQENWGPIWTRLRELWDAGYTTISEAHSALQAFAQTPTPDINAVSSGIRSMALAANSEAGFVSRLAGGYQLPGGNDGTGANLRYGAPLPVGSPITDILERAVLDAGERTSGQPFGLGDSWEETRRRLESLRDAGYTTLTQAYNDLSTNIPSSQQTATPTANAALVAEIQTYARSIDPQAYSTFADWLALPDPAGNYCSVRGLTNNRESISFMDFPLSQTWIDLRNGVIGQSISDSDRAVIVGRLECLVAAGYSSVRTALDGLRAIPNMSSPYFYMTTDELLQAAEDLRINGSITASNGVVTEGDVWWNDEMIQLLSSHPGWTWNDRARFALERWDELQQAALAATASDAYDAMLPSQLQTRRNAIRDTITQARWDEIYTITRQLHNATGLPDDAEDVRRTVLRRFDDLRIAALDAPSYREFRNYILRMAGGGGEWSVHGVDALRLNEVAEGIENRPDHLNIHDGEWQRIVNDVRFLYGFDSTLQGAYNQLRAWPNLPLSPFVTTLPSPATSATAPPSAATPPPVPPPTTTFPASRPTMRTVQDSRHVREWAAANIPDFDTEPVRERIREVHSFVTENEWNNEPVTAVTLTREVDLYFHGAQHNPEFLHDLLEVQREMLRKVRARATVYNTQTQNITNRNAAVRNFIGDFTGRSGRARSSSWGVASLHENRWSGRFTSRANPLRLQVLRGLGFGTLEEVFDTALAIVQGNPGISHANFYREMRAGTATRWDMLRQGATPPTTASTSAPSPTPPSSSTNPLSSIPAGIIGDAIQDVHANLGNFEQFLRALYGPENFRQRISQHMGAEIQNGTIRDRLDRQVGAAVGTPVERGERERAIGLLRAIQDAGFRSLADFFMANGGLASGLSYPMSTTSAYYVAPPPPPPPAPHENTLIPDESFLPQATRRGLVPPPPVARNPDHPAIFAATTDEERAAARDKVTLLTGILSNISGAGARPNAQNMERNAALRNVWNALMTRVDAARYGTSSAATPAGIMDDLNAHFRAMGQNVEVRVHIGSEYNPAFWPSGSNSYSVQTRRPDINNGNWYSCAGLGFTGSGATTNSPDGRHGSRHSQDGGLAYYVGHLFARNIPGVAQASGGMYEINQIRRMEHAINFLIRYGEAPNVTISADQTRHDGNSEHYLRPSFDQETNLLRVIARQYRYIIRELPFLRRFTYDFATGEIKVKDTGDIIDPNALVGYVMNMAGTNQARNAPTTNAEVRRTIAGEIDQFNFMTQNHTGGVGDEHPGWRLGFSLPVLQRYIINQTILDNVDQADGFVRTTLSETHSLPFTTLYSRGTNQDGKHYGNAHYDSILNTVKPIVQGLKDLIPIKVFMNPTDAGLNVDPLAQAVYIDGKVYLFTENIASPQEAQRIILNHEIRHHGLRGILGDRMHTVMQQVWHSQSAAIRQFVRKFSTTGKSAFDLTTQEGRLEAAEEYIVSLAQDPKVKNSALNRVIIAVRNALRALGFKLRYTEKDLRTLVAQAGTTKALKRAASRSQSSGTRFNRGSRTPFYRAAYPSKVRYGGSQLSILEYPHDSGITALDVYKFLAANPRGIKPVVTPVGSVLDVSEPLEEVRKKRKNGIASSAPIRFKVSFPIQDMRLLSASEYSQAEQPYIYDTTSADLFAYKFGTLRYARTTVARTSLEAMASDASTINDYGAKIMSAIKRGVTVAMDFLMPVDRLINWAVSLERFAPLKQNLSGLRRLYNEMQSQQDQYLGQGTMLWERATKAALKSPEQLATLNRVLANGTFYQLFPDRALNQQPWNENQWITGGMQERTGLTLAQAHDAVTTDFARLDNATVLAYHEVIAHMAKMRDKYKAAMLSFADRTTVPGSAANIELRQKIAQRFASLKGPYAPLSRFGDYVVQVYNPGATEQDPGSREARFHFENEIDARKFHAQVNADGQYTATLELRSSITHTRSTIPVEFLSRIQQTLAEAGVPESTRTELETDFERIWLSLAPESSAIKHTLQRKGIRGYDQDMLRSFLTYTQRHARSIAFLTRGLDIRQAYHDMRNIVRAEVQAGNPHTPDMQRMLDKLQKHDALVRAEKISPLVQQLSKIPFAWYLFSPSVYLVQTAQPYNISLPKLAVRHGFTDSFAAINRHYMRQLGKKDGMAFYANERIDQWLPQAEQIVEAEARGETISPIWDNLNNEDRLLLGMKIATLRNAIDITLSHDAMDVITNGGQSEVNKSMQVASIFMRSSELASRKATFAAAFELEYKKTGDFLKATQYGVDVCMDTLYDYSKSNRPIALTGNLGRLFGQFRIFQLHTAFKMIQLGWDGIRSTNDPASRKDAVKELGYLMATSMAMAGATGLPFAGAFFAALGFLGYAFGDSDDPWDPEQEFRNAVEGIPGGVAITKGLPALVGLDLSRRIGMMGVFDVFQGEPPPRVKGGDLYAYYAAKATGPIGGVMTEAFRARQAFIDGDWTQVLVMSSPRIVKDFAKAYQMQTEGVKTGAGKLIIPSDQIGVPETVLALLGVNPTEIALARERQRDIQEISATIAERKRILSRRFYDAVRKDDADSRADAVDHIREFNLTQPEFAFTASELSSGLKGVFKKEAGLDSKQEAKIIQKYLPK